MANIINLTPHEVTLYADKDCMEVTKNGYTSLVLKEGAKPLAIYPSQGVARVTSFKNFMYTINSVPVYTTSFGDVEGLPEPRSNTYYLVSSITAQAVKGRRDILIGEGAVRDAEGRIVGCTAFGRL
jgi:hypothetical protein